MAPGAGCSQCSKTHPVLTQLSDPILEVDCVIMPVHLEYDWTSAVIKSAAQEQVYHGSMGVDPSLFCIATPVLACACNVSVETSRTVVTQL